MAGLRRHQFDSSPNSDRLLSLFSSSPPSSAAAVGGELHEDEVLWTNATATTDSNVNPSNHIPNSSPSLSRKSVNNNDSSKQAVGILAALAPPRSSSAVSSASTSASTSPSAARAIPSIPKPKQQQAEFSLSLPSGRIYHQSAPLNVPVPRPKRAIRDFDSVAYDNVDDDERLPPHEIVARASAARDSPMTTFSVLEGAGRTLKGRDLRRVRNAVFQKTGFLD